MEDRLRDIAKFLNQDAIKKICGEYEKHKRESTIRGFNVFTLISDLYYRENFHSDILACLLDRNGSHGEGRKFFDCFIEFLSKQESPLKKSSFDKKKFTNYRVEREQGRIDVGVFDETSKKAIIIENKINRARDMDRQLLSYVEFAQEKEYEVLAAVYISPDIPLRPDCANWTSDEINKIEKILVPVVAYAPNGKSNMADHYITSCIEDANNCDVISVLRQYGALLKFIGKDAMNYDLMEKFYEEVKNPERWKTVQIFRQMLDEIPRFLPQKIQCMTKNLDKNRKLLKSLKIDEKSTHLQIEQAGVLLHIDIGFCKNDSVIELSIGDQREDNSISKNLRTLIESSSLKGQLKEQDWNRYVRRFEFPEDEAKLFAFIEKLLSPKFASPD